MAAAVERAHAAFTSWRNVPAPRRGELVRLFGEELRAHKSRLAALVTLEAGKISSEGAGEVQEMIDICDFAVGLSRQLYGLTIASERPGHRMMEQWHPLGVVGVISAFNFPVAVWAWNAALALVCGNAVVWKPSEKTPLTALATQALFERALTRFGHDAPAHLCQVVNGRAATGEALVDRPPVPLVGHRLHPHGPRCRPARGRALRPLPARAGRQQRHHRRAFSRPRPRRARHRVRRLGHGRPALHHHPPRHRPRQHPRRARRSPGARPRQPEDRRPARNRRVDRPAGRPAAAFDAMQQALAAARAQGGRVAGGERVLAEAQPQTWYAAPALVQMPSRSEVVCHETFAPILYTLRYETLDEAIALQNAVPQGLSSAIFTNDLREAEQFLARAAPTAASPTSTSAPRAPRSAAPSAARRRPAAAASRARTPGRAYMRRATNTVNYSRELPLAQGVKFDV
jgi:aldehyde dehydrogenase (NAD+)